MGKNPKSEILIGQGILIAQIGNMAKAQKNI